MSKKYTAYSENTTKLKKTESSKPSGYDGKDTLEADNIANELKRTKSFSYSPTSDASYIAAKKEYTENANEALKNTLGASAALTGGYANSWGNIAAQREYNSVMSKLESIIPELYEAAYERYRDGIDDKFKLLDEYRASDKEKYSRYRDDVADWQDARDYYYGIVRDDIKDQQTADEIEIDLQKLVTERFYKLGWW